MSSAQPVERSGSEARNIESILKLEHEDQQSMSALQKSFHAVGWFVGTVYFIILQCFCLVVWVVLNAGPLSLPGPFDPYPFPLLSAVLALEAVLLTSFVLIRQSANDLQSDRRNHLDLQINLLAEEEATAILRLLRKVAEKLDVEEEQKDAVLAGETNVEKIAQHIRSREE
ncbi:DUF1003 domain-containing protein [Bradyrhizobium sp. NFR13]|uniref:DUF1003 domain-containing protein n=1 Tax=Bradyrhizobium sp. NFR13 TaxID=1566285 RepID=UPI000B2364E3|nr:DUF1003 domain-containing protein [Bradyrhizobium sp. NFR13]